jgi:hypothetical protein
MRRSALFGLILLLFALPAKWAPAQESIARRLYVVTPGIRNYLEFGGAGILVFDIDDGHKFLKRITTPASLESAPDNIKGVCGDAATSRLYFTTRSKLYALDLKTEKVLWETAPPNGTDRMSITPDGRFLYVPSIEKDTWNVIDPASGKLIKEIETKSGAHNTVVSREWQVDVPWRTQVALSLCREHRVPYHRQKNRPAKRRDPAFRGEWPNDACLRLRQ